MREKGEEAGGGWESRQITMHIPCGREREKEWRLGGKSFKTMVQFEEYFSKASKDL